VPPCSNALTLWCSAAEQPLGAIAETSVKPADNVHNIVRQTTSSDAAKRLSRKSGGVTNGIVCMFVCLFVCLFVCMFVRLSDNSDSCLHETAGIGWQCYLCLA